MSKVLEYKRHVRNILDAIELGKYKRGYYSVNSRELDSDIIHKHYVSYVNRGQEIYPDYSYNAVNIAEKQDTRFDVDTFVDDHVVERSVLILSENQEILYKFNPKSMDDIRVSIRSNGAFAEKIALKELLTEEQYFMYTTLYDIPAFEDVHALIVLAHELRAELMRKKYKISGLLRAELIDMQSESFLLEVEK